ncbi:hypothetical protein GOP47_0021959 [Adiantum capillus-veneris]|uniref:Uncharacterized protein n=1 Tax=Adiantum capillus-veneris TaxID=13818 RepID=A0A9D4Z7E6_ADICA|nr:hypothetical protein GOP47_0021959 [Adiantum capillus-veneris]
MRPSQLPVMSTTASHCFMRKQVASAFASRCRSWAPMQGSSTSVASAPWPPPSEQGLQTTLSQLILKVTLIVIPIEKHYCAFLEDLELQIARKVALLHAASNILLGHYIAACPWDEIVMHRLSCIDSNPIVSLQYHVIPPTLKLPLAYLYPPALPRRHWSCQQHLHLRRPSRLWWRPKSRNHCQPLSIHFWRHAYQYVSTY